LWLLLHNIADLTIFFGFGFAGLVAELFPRESFAYRQLKQNLPFMNSLLGRAFFYVLFGMFAMGNYSAKGNSVCQTDPERYRHTDTLLTGEESAGLWGFFCVASGIFMVLVGAATMVTGLKYRLGAASQTQQEFLLAAQPSLAPHETDADGRIMVPFAPFPTQV
jgi:hypothetical protein